MKHDSWIARKKMIVLMLCFVMLTALGGSAMAVGTKVSDPYTADELYALSAPAVFYVRVFNESGVLKSTGTGFCITKDGRALTAAHVVMGGAKVTAVMHDGKELAASVLLCDDATDAAVLQLPKGTYTCLSVAAANPVSGIDIFAIGYPTKDTKIITQGIVNNPSGTVNGRTRLMVSSQIVNGMSGGPVLNGGACVVGIISGSVRTMSGIHIAVPGDDVRSAVKTVQEGKK